MDDVLSKGISIPFTAGLIALVFTFGLISYNKTKPMQRAADNNLNTVNQSLTANSFSMYDGTIVPGSAVISAINTKASPQITIHVTTDASSRDYTSASYNVVDIDDPAYIEENGEFQSTLKKNANGSTIGITFTQVSSGL